MRNIAIPTVIPAILLAPKGFGGTVVGSGVEEEFVRIWFAEGIATMSF